MGERLHVYRHWQILSLCDALSPSEFPWALKTFKKYGCWHSEKVTGMVAIRHQVQTAQRYPEG
jgi:hypothetical protein